MSDPDDTNVHGYVVFREALRRAMASPPEPEPEPHPDPTHAEWMEEVIRLRLEIESVETERAGLIQRLRWTQEQERRWKLAYERAKEQTLEDVAAIKRLRIEIQQLRRRIGDIRRWEAKLDAMGLGGGGFPAPRGQADALDTTALLKLCHPDRHPPGLQELATQMTQELLKRRQREK